MHDCSLCIRCVGVRTTSPVAIVLPGMIFTCFLQRINRSGLW